MTTYDPDHGERLISAGVIVLLFGSIVGNTLHVLGYDGPLAVLVATLVIAALLIGRGIGEITQS